MLAIPLSPVPSITIDYADDTTPVKEPPSPFDNIAIVAPEDDAIRSSHLLPPPCLSPLAKQLNVQKQPRSPTGLDSARFEALLRACKGPSGTKLDLRKEVTIKAHQSKQAERRNTFLARVDALPSPSAAHLPVTPPESPAVFHFTLPSPGLVSPLALFETLEKSTSERHVRVEQIDFRAQARKEAEALAALTGNMRQSLQVHGLGAARSTLLTPAPCSRVPSLDQISKRLGGNLITSRPQITSSRLPAFLQRNMPNAGTNTGQSHSTEIFPHASPASSVTAHQSAPKLLVSLAPSNGRSQANACGTKGLLANPASTPKLALPDANGLVPLNAKTSVPLASRAERGSQMMEKLLKRVSAPARINKPIDRHPVLKVPGAF